MTKLKNAVEKNTTNLLKMAVDFTNLKIKSIMRNISVPQMVTWMLYAAAVHDDFSRFVRYISST